MTKRTCWECKWLHSDCQSDLTPGWNSSIECRKQHFSEISLVDHGEEDTPKGIKIQEKWDAAIKRAETCSDYKKGKN